MSATLSTKRMSKRAHALATAKVCGYHNDGSEFTQILIYSRVSRRLLDDAWRTGVAAKRAGMLCGCAQCGHLTEIDKRFGRAMKMAVSA